MRALLHRLETRLEIRDHELLYLFLELTRKCNLSCLHCGSDCTTRESGGRLQPQQWVSIIDYCCERFSPELTFIFTGGEPLLEPNLCAYGARAVRNGRRWSTVTNGMLLDARMLERLMRAGVNGITISLDGLERSHNLLRGSPAAFGRALRAVELLGSSDVPVRDVVTCIHPANLGELDSIAELLIARGIPSWRLFRIFPSGRAAGNGRLLLSFEQTRRMTRWIADNRRRLKARGLAVSASCEGYLRFRTDRRVRDAPFFCRAGINIASVLADGTITGCPNNDPTFSVGTVLQDDLVTLWEQGFDRFRNREWARRGPCAECPDFADCRGSSIHLWHAGSSGPAFCYERDLEEPPRPVTRQRRSGL